MKLNNMGDYSDTDRFPTFSFGDCAEPSKTGNNRVKLRKLFRYQVFDRQLLALMVDLELWVTVGRDHFYKSMQHFDIQKLVMT